MREFKDLKIAVAGTGYVGLSLATLLAQHHRVTAVDIVPEKVEQINRRTSPIQDAYIEKYFAEKELDLTATLDGRGSVQRRGLCHHRRADQLRQQEEFLRHLRGRSGDRAGASSAIRKRSW